MKKTTVLIIATLQIIAILLIYGILIIVKHFIGFENTVLLAMAVIFITN